MCPLDVLGLQGIVVKCTGAIFFHKMDWKRIKQLKIDNILTCSPNHTWLCVEVESKRMFCLSYIINRAHKIIFPPQKRFEC